MHDKIQFKWDYETHAPTFIKGARLQCGECSKTFYQKGNMKRHVDKFYQDS